ncbi:alpha/beta hydrolase, partial [Pseudomonas sp. MWU12-2534b]
MSDEFYRSRFSFSIDDTAVDVSAIYRGGDRTPIVFLHGFGSTKEDYADIVRHRAFDERPFVAYDAPGCGATQCVDLSRITIPFLVETALNVIGRMGFERFHL